MIKPKVSKEVLSEQAEEMVKNLERLIGEREREIGCLQVVVADLERKIRWLKKEILS